MDSKSERWRYIWSQNGREFRALGSVPGRQGILHRDRPSGHARGGVQRAGGGSVVPQARHERECHRGEVDELYFLQGLHQDTVPFPRAVLRRGNQVGV